MKKKKKYTKQTCTVLKASSYVHTSNNKKIGLLYTMINVHRAFLRKTEFEVKVRFKRPVSVRPFKCDFFFFLFIIIISFLCIYTVMPICNSTVPIPRRHLKLKFLSWNIIFRFHETLFINAVFLNRPQKYIYKKKGSVNPFFFLSHPGQFAIGPTNFNKKKYVKSKHVEVCC